MTKATTENTKVSRIFEYLLAVKNLNERNIYHLSDYEEHLWEKDIPEIDGCFLGGTGEVEEAWLEVHKQEIREAPAPPKSLDTWINNWKDPNLNPEKVKYQFRGYDEEKDEEIIEKFDDDEDRVIDYEEWYTNFWLPWAREAAPKYKIQHLYHRLFALHQRLQREGDDLEICWGHGLLAWKNKDIRIYRHMLVTRLELQFNAKKGIFMLIPTSKGTEMETDMLPIEEIPNINRIINMEHQIEEIDLNVWNREMITPVLREIVNSISPEGLFSNVDEISELTNNPVISYSPAIFLRKVGGRIWQRELENAVEKINDGYPVPNTIKQLTTATDSTETSTNDHIEQSNFPEQWSDEGEQLLFPLPTNNEQRLIAKKLAYNDGVLVQGPPGTGKSHTIANLISHLLAHGKRVLVTSEKGRALEVLRDKIPEEIRSLCVSVLGGDSRSVKEVEDSVKYIAENLDSQQIESLEQEINNLSIQLDHTKRNIARIEHEINKAAEREHTFIRIGSEEYTPLEAATWLTANKAYDWIPDKLSLDDKFPFNEEETNEFFNLHGILRQEDRLLLENISLSTKEIMLPDDFENEVSKINTIEKELKKHENIIENWEFNLSQLNFSVQEKIKNFENLLQLLNTIKEHQWLSLILREILLYEEKKHLWQDFCEDIYKEVTLIEKLRQELIVDEIQIPEDINLILLEEDLKFIKERIENSKSIGWLFKNIFGRKYNYIFEKCKVNNLEIRRKEDIEKLISYIQMKTLTINLVIKWNRTFSEYDGPHLNNKQARLTTSVKEFLDLLQEVLRFPKKVTTEYQEIHEEVIIPRNPEWDSKEWYEYLINGLIALKHKLKLNVSQKKFDATEEKIRESIEKSGHVELIDLLRKACSEKDVDLWKESWNELKRLEQLKEPYSIYKHLKQKLNAVTPLWSNELDRIGGNGRALTPPDDIRKAWKWSQLNKWLTELQNKKSIEELNNELHQERRNESKLIKQLISVSAWKSQIERTTKEQKRSLISWLNNIRRIGKGYSQYVNVYRKEARKEMEIARGAIPVWIMPMRSVIENFDLDPAQQFDVIIVDESSQSDLFSLSVLLRGKKAVIVGDDQQISPEGVGTNLEKVHELIARYLQDIPNPIEFEIKTSLYDIANRIFDSKIVLREHFRCVPEIIQFSNDLMYGGRIDPLRLPLEKEILEPPVKAVFVPEGYRREDIKKAVNEPEAEAIVKAIEQMIMDERYKEKTIGVISLQGHDQARLIENLLREAIGEEEMINRKIICGDAYSFQGDERDVILLSLVAAPNLRIGPMTNRAAEQRFNVAASRARDQMILFHSVELEDLNPGCVRYRLLEYCKNPHRVQLAVEEVKEEFDSKFEEDVFRILTARGYRVVPQVKVGTLGKRIDLVVEGMRNRLAIECDGDRWHGLDKWEDDIERQRILERVGWTFWRIRGSDFYLNREKALEPLWKKLDEMGIKPIS